MGVQWVQVPRGRNKYSALPDTRHPRRIQKKEKINASINTERRKKGNIYISSEHSKVIIKLIEIVNKKIRKETKDKHNLT